MNATDVRTFSSQLLEAMKTKLESTAKENTEPLTRASKSLVVIRNSIEDLKQFVSRHGFADKMREIEFFKEIKPVFSSQYFYYEALFNMKITEPPRDSDDFLPFLRRKLSSITTFFYEHREFYSYCLSGATDLDELYFISRSGTFHGPDIDTKFSTGYDSILAKLLADQMLNEYIGTLASSSEPESSTLTWTGKKADLIELMYALHAAGAFNHGKAEIKQIASTFESLFNINLGNFYRHFSEITIRKSGQTNFIDHLKVTLEKRIDEMM